MVILFNMTTFEDFEIKLMNTLNLINPEKLLQSICNNLNLTVEAVKSQSRKKELIEARKIFARKMYPFYTEQKIATFLNKKTHAAIHHYLFKIKDFK